jgi:PI3-kinase family, ras-binding domain
VRVKSVFKSDGGLQRPLTHFTVSVDPNQEVAEVRNKIFRKFSIIDKVNSQGKSPEDYVLKATGFREYIMPNLDLGNNRYLLSAKSDCFKLLDYDYVRRCISKNQQIELTLVGAADLHEQITEGMSHSSLMGFLSIVPLSSHSSFQPFLSSSILLFIHSSLRPFFFSYQEC